MVRVCIYSLNIVILFTSWTTLPFMKCFSSSLKGGSSLEPEYLSQIFSQIVQEPKHSIFPFVHHAIGHTRVGHVWNSGTKFSWESFSLMLSVYFNCHVVPKNGANNPLAAGEHTQIIPCVFRPWNDQRQEYALVLHYNIGRHIEQNTDQHLYEVADIPYGLNPSVVITILSLYSFNGVVFIEVRPCFTIRWMYHLFLYCSTPSI
jgi:hypothetical protein